MSELEESKPYWEEKFIADDTRSSIYREEKKKIIQTSSKSKVNSINLRFPLRSYRRGFFEGNSTVVSAARENIKILLLTRTGERLINPSIGLPRSLDELLLFEQKNTEEFLPIVKKHIINALENFLPEISLIELNVYDNNNIPLGVANLDDNQVLIRMKYNIFISDNEVAEDEIQLAIDNNAPVKILR